VRARPLAGTDDRTTLTSAAAEGRPLAPSAGRSPHGALVDARPGGGSIGFYLHIPFCERRCHYCSFNTAPLEHDGSMARFLAALGAEIALLGTLPWARDVAVATVFLGGGTPSLLAPDDLAALLGALHRAFRIAEDAEVTVECNPESVTRARLEAYRASGVNRVSLGVQSLDDAILARLGRLHDARRARAAFATAREAGFANVSVDLMYGLPGQDVAAWQHSVDGVLDWRPDHLSAYALTLDGGSTWSAGSVEGLPAEDSVVAQYWALVRTARDHGLEHYEISNYARPGCRARHNEIYWRAEEYLAAGPGACGFVGDVRYGNARPLPRYCAAVEKGSLPIDTSERLAPRQRLGERLILGLRTADGVPAAWLDARVSGDGKLARRVDAWRERGLLAGAADRVRLTEAGFLVSDALFVELL
jgi:oxygen-independent coproporphyrinogen-3 oxidase